MNKPLAIDLFCGLGGVFYVYEHWRPDADKCFYVGKGQRKRAFSVKHRSQHHKNISNKLIALGLAVEVRLITVGLSEADAFALEKERIAFWRSHGVDLVNKTDGGEGPSGYRQSEDHRRKKGDARRAFLQTPEGREQRARMHAAALLVNVGSSHKAETRAKMSQTRKGRPLTPSQRDWVQRARKKTPQHIEAIRIAKARIRAQRLAEASS